MQHSVNGISEKLMEVDQSQMKKRKRRASTDCNASYSRCKMDQEEQNGSAKVSGECNISYIRPKRNAEVSHNLIVAKELFDKLFTYFQKTSVDFTEHQKKVMYEDMAALEIQYEKYANIIKQNIDHNLTFTLKYLNSATQMSQRVKYQIWKDQIDYWFSDIRKKRESVLSTDLNNKMKMSNSIPAENLSCQEIKVSFKSNVHFRGDVPKSNDVSKPLSDQGSDGNLTTHKLKMWEDAPGKSMPLLLDDDVTLEEHQTESQDAENYLPPSSEKKNIQPESTCTSPTSRECHEVLDSTEVKHKANLCKLSSSSSNNVYCLENHLDQLNIVAKETNSQTVNKCCKSVYQCTICLKYFQSQKFLKTHEIKHKTLFYRCDFCNKLKKSIYELNKHVSEHLTDESKKYLCKVCFSHFETKYKFLKHLKQQHHLTTDMYLDKMLCVICAEKYDDPNKLILHIKKDHKSDSMVKRSRENRTKGTSKYQCLHCNIYCANLKLLEVHVIIVHEAPPYVCAVCDSKFWTRAQYNVHLLRHTRQEGLRAGLKLEKRGHRHHNHND